MAEKICLSNLKDAKKQEIMKVGFDASWGHRRNANNCLGILMDLSTNKIIAFHIVHHGIEQNETLTSTDKHAKCMESISLFKIIENTDINNIDHLFFVHDCDLTDEKMIKEYLPKAIIKFDPNHYAKKNKKIIENFCSKNFELKDLSEKIENFYSILIHEKESSTEEKITKWLGVPDHFIQSEDLDETQNKDAIEKLKKFVAQLAPTFNDIDSNLNTNAVESFNYTRALIANKNNAYRISWRIRSYIAIIKWNDPYWESTILNAFDIEITEELKIFQEKRLKKKNKKKLITNTAEYKKKIANQKKKRKAKYKVTNKDKCVHHYHDDSQPDPYVFGFSINKFSKFQRAIIIAITLNTFEDKKYMSTNKIINTIKKTYPNENEASLRKNIQSQLTRLTHDGILSLKRLAYSLSVKIIM